MKGSFGRVAVVCGAVLLSACSGGGGPSKVAVEASPTAMKAAARRTLGLHTTGIDLVVSVPTAGTPAIVRASGVVDLDRTRSQLTVDTGRIFGGLGAAAADLQQPLTVVLDEQTVYFGWKYFASASAKPWLRASVTSPTPNATTVLLPLGPYPADVLAALLDTSEVVEVGTETITGVATRHFSANFTLGAAIDRAGGRTAERLRAALGRFKVDAEQQRAPSRVEAWIDADGTVRRLQLDVAVGSARRVTVQATLHDIGSTIQVEVPASVQVGEYGSVPALTFTPSTAASSTTVPAN